MDKDFIPVKEFAKLAGITRQAVYKQLNNQLKESLKVENGIKLININALSLFKNNQLTPVEQPVDNNLTTSLQANIDILKAENESLNKQLLVKDNQIEELNNHLKTQMELNKNNQILLLRQQQPLLPSNTEPAADPTKEPGTVPEQKKRVSLWDKIFNREN